MSAIGKEFKVNVSKTLTEAKGAGIDGTLYIPQDGTSMVFSGVEYAALNSNARSYIMDQISGTENAAYKVTISAVVSHRTGTLSGLSGMPTSYIEAGIKCSLLGSDEQDTTNGYQKVVITVKTTYDGSAVAAKVPPSLTFSNITASGLYLQSSAGAVLTAIEAGKPVQMAGGNGTYTLAVYVKDGALTAGAKLFTCVANDIKVTSPYDNVLTKNTTEQSINCQQSSWIVESNKTINEIVSALEAGNIYAAPFLISSGVVVRSTSVTNGTSSGSVTLDSGHTAYIIIPSTKSLTSFTDSSGLITYTGANYLENGEVFVKFADGSVKPYKVYAIDINFKNIKIT